MTRAVLDASIALSWCFGDEATPENDALLDFVRDNAAVVPALWFLYQRPGYGRCRQARRYRSSAKVEAVWFKAMRR
jgi:hypothetical protein